MSEARVQQEAPEFTAQAVMPDGSFKEIKLADYRGKYVALFFYPLDFTFVCPTELIALSEKIGEFQERNAEVLAISIDSHFSHAAWRSTPREQGGVGELQYPLISDLDKSIARQYGVLLEKPGIALRGLFLLDKKGVLKHITINDLPIGRNVDEILRVLDAIQFSEEHGEVCPANWQKGKEGMKPDKSGLQSYSKKHYSKVA
jgi:peroxiredoxin (alkyl hydroperoxide reductase subunit C)